MEADYINKPVVLMDQNNKDLTNTSQTVKSDIRKYWTKEYINSKIEDVKNPNHRMFFQFLWMSGVRVTEAINLLKSDIDFNSYLMTVKWLKSRKYERRVVPLHPHLRDLLRVFTAALKQSDRVFGFSRQRAWQLCKRHMGGNPHQFRHSFAVNWLKCDGDVVTLHRILGHSKIQTTMEYLKIVPIDQGKELMKIQF